ncbi:transporter [Chitinivorax sp. B]|uniref:transporter n=1 Tax=Chitinivorax sp. B TaxID=2502235 RepID=UPI0010F9A39C|nr:transporter [Chitinivorax sp. B]
MQPAWCAAVLAILIPIVSQAAQDPRLAKQQWIDARLKHRKVTSDIHLDLGMLRYDRIDQVTDNWSSWSRLELNFVSTDLPARDNRTGQWHTGMGDTLMHYALITSPTPGFRYGAGLQVTIPTNTRDSLGYGRYTWAPAVMAEVDLPVSRGSYAQLIVRNMRDAGGDDHRTKFRQTIIQPTVQIRLPQHFFVEAVADGRVNYETDKKWFVSTGIGIGRFLSRQAMVSLTWSKGVKDDMPNYDTELEARVMYWF